MKSQVCQTTLAAVFLVVTAAVALGQSQRPRSQSTPQQVKWPSASQHRTAIPEKESTKGVLPNFFEKGNIFAAPKQTKATNTYPALPTYDLVQLMVVFHAPTGPKQTFHLQLQRGTTMSQVLGHFRSRFEQLFPGGSVWISLGRPTDGGNIILMPIDYSTEYANPNTDYVLRPGDQIHVRERKAKPAGGTLHRVYAPVDQVVVHPFRGWCEDTLGWDPGRPFGGFFWNMGSWYSNDSQKPSSTPSR